MADSMKAFESVEYAQVSAGWWWAGAFATVPLTWLLFHVWRPGWEALHGNLAGLAVLCMVVGAYRRGYVRGWRDHG